MFAVEDMMEKKDIPVACKELLTGLPDLFGGLETILSAKERTENPEALEALDRLEKLYHILETYDMLEHVTFDLGMLSHYEYYTGVIFKAYSYGTGDAIVTGGRYDNLVEQFGKKTPAIGLAFVLDELMAALQSQQVEIEAKESDILILYISLCHDLRMENHSVRLMRKNAQTPLDAYKRYGRRNEVSSILYIDDTGEVTEFDLNA